MWDKSRALPELEKQTVVKMPIWQSLRETAAPPPHPRLSPDPPQEREAVGLRGEDSRGEQSASPLALAPVLGPRGEAAALGPGPLLSQQLLDEPRGRQVHRAHLPEAGQPHGTEACSALHLGEGAATLDTRPSGQALEGGAPSGHMDLMLKTLLLSPDFPSLESLSVTGKVLRTLLRHSGPLFGCLGQAKVEKSLKVHTWTLRFSTRAQSIGAQVALSPTR